MTFPPEPELDDLYRELLLDHYRNPRNKGRLEQADVSVEGYNPLCGDEVQLMLDLDDGVIKDVRFLGRGCSISQASASMMTTAIKGQKVAKVRHLIEAFRKMIVDGKGADPELGDLEALEGISHMPVRVKCAT